MAASSFSHVVLEQGSAPAGSAYKAVFQVSHGCQSAATTGISVQIPSGFQGAKPYPKAGWTVSVKREKLAKPYDSHGKQVTDDVSVVTWVAASKDAALPDAHFDEFMLRGKLPEAAGALWFKVLQTCETGRMDWSEIPAPGSSAKALKLPAPRLDVTANAQSAELKPAGQPDQAVQVTGAWVRGTVPGQQGTGAFMTLTAKAATRLVGLSSPVAGVAEVHEMKMEGDVMRMRALPGLELPAGKKVELKSGSYHIMLMDLKQPLAQGGTVPLTLVFKDGKGIESRVELILPVAVSAPGAPASTARASEHQH
ncbi:MAG: hypothetical protein JWR60_4302 [Polaromonas sp.]|nr:hypothetical protein [Polaromonas sp.]